MINETKIELHEQAQKLSVLDNVKLGRDMKRRRDLLGMSLEEMADSLEIPLAKLQKIERIAEE